MLNLGSALIKKVMVLQNFVAGRNGPRFSLLGFNPQKIVGN